MGKRGNKFKPGKSDTPRFTQNAVSGSSNSLNVRFSFQNMPAKTGYSVHCCDTEHCAALAKHMYTWGQMTWQEINASHRHGLGTEKIERNAIKIQLPSSVTPDTKILSARYKGKTAMLGYREHDTFHILFLDHNFSLYNHGS